MVPNKLWLGQIASNKRKLSWAISDYLRLFQSISGWLWQYMGTLGYFWLFLAIYGYLWLPLAITDYYSRWTLKSLGGQLNAHFFNSSWGVYWHKNFMFLIIIMFKETISDHMIFFLDGKKMSHISFYRAIQFLENFEILLITREFLDIVSIFVLQTSLFPKLKMILHWKMAVIYIYKWVAIKGAKEKYPNQKLFFLTPSLSKSNLN